MESLNRKISEFHSNAEKGKFIECYKCPRNPMENETTYAYTCKEHFGTSKNGLIIILRDPGGSSDGSARTNKLCPYCNGDKSAIKFRELLTQFKIPSSKIYFANAILHGYFSENKKSINRFELNSCKGVVSKLFGILSPKVVLALGKEAFETSYEILSNNNMRVSMGLWIKNEFYFGAFNSTHLFSMPHISFLGPNLSKYGLSTQEVFKKLSANINMIFKK